MWTAWPWVSIPRSGSFWWIQGIQALFIWKEYLEKYSTWIESTISSCTLAFSRFLVLLSWIKFSNIVAVRFRELLICQDCRVMVIFMVLGHEVYFVSLIPSTSRGDVLGIVGF